MLYSLLDDIAQKGSHVQRTLRALDTLNALSTGRFGVGTTFITWYEGPYSKGWPVIRHCKTRVPDTMSAHATIEAKALADTLETQETAFFKSVGKLAKHLSSFPCFRALKAYPALRFDIGPAGGAVSMEPLKQYPGPTFGGVKDFYYHKDWALFASLLSTLETLEGIGTGKPWVVAKKTDSVSQHQSNAFGQTFPITSECGTAAYHYAMATVYANSLDTPEKIVLLDPDTPLLSLDTPSLTHTWEEGETSTEEVFEHTPF